MNGPIAPILRFMSLYDEERFRRLEKHASLLVAWEEHDRPADLGWLAGRMAVTPDERLAVASALVQLVAIVITGLVAELEPKIVEAFTEVSLMVEAGDEYEGNAGALILRSLGLTASALGAAQQAAKKAKIKKPPVGELAIHNAIAAIDALSRAGAAVKAGTHVANTLEAVSIALSPHVVLDAVRDKILFGTFTSGFFSAVPPAIDG